MTGTEIPNPNYKKGSKNPLTASPTLISNNPEDVISPGNIIAGAALKNALPLTQLNIDKNKYQEYDVYPNAINTEEELQKERAKNQSGIEQLGNALAQIVENEILLGLGIAASDLVDLGINILKKEPNDYTNAVTEYLTELQDKNRERLAIYRENPNKSWDVGDFAWWTDNFVSVGSSLSLLIPSTGLAKVAGFAAKGLNLTQKTKGAMKAIANVGNRVSKGKKLLFRPSVATANLSNLAETAIASTASRLAESYMESRDVYETSKTEILNSLNQLSNEERENFFNRNNRFIGMSDEEIATQLASEGAGDTFANDMKLLAIDFLQYKSLNKLYKGHLKNRIPGAEARITQRNAIRKLAGEAEDTFENINFKTKFLESVKHGFRNPFNIVKSIELSEGFEEGYQGIQQQKGQEYYKMFLDPKYSTKNIQSYLTDDSVWEQAFWGILGGVAFKGAYKGFNLAKEAIDRKKANKNIIEGQERNKISEEKIQSQAINDRFSKIDSYIKDMNTLNKGLSLTEYEKDENGNDIIEDGIKKQKRLSSEEIFKEKQRITDDFVTDLVLNATDTGTYDLLEEFINNPNFNKYLENQGLTSTEIDRYLNDRVKSKMTKVYDEYGENLDLFLNNVDNPDFRILQLAARQLTRNRLDIDSYNEIIRDIDEKLLNIGEIDSVEGSDFNKILIDTITESLNYNDSQKSEYTKQLEEGEISKSAYNKYIDELNNYRKYIYEMMQEIKSSEDSINELISNIKNNIKSRKNTDKSVEEFNSEYNKIYQELVKSLTRKNIYGTQTEDLLKERAINILERQIAIANLPVEGKDIIDIYIDLNNGIDKFVKDRKDNAYRTVVNYLENSEDVNLAFNELMKEENLSQNILDALEILKLGHETTKSYYDDVITAKNKIISDREKDKQKEQIVEENGKVVDEIKSKITKEKVDKIITHLEDPNKVIIEEGEQQLISDELIGVEELREEYLKEQETLTYSPPGYEDLFESEARRYREQNIISDFIINHENKHQLFEIIKQIKQISLDDPNYKSIFNIVASELIQDQGIIPEDANRIAREQIAETLQLFTLNEAISPKDRSRYKSLASQIKYGLKVSENEESYSATSLVGDSNEIKEQKKQLILEFIEEYKNKYGIKDSVLDVDKFFLDLINDDDISFEQAKNIFNYFSLLKNKKDYNAINYHKYNQFKKDAESYFNTLREAKGQLDSISSYMHINPPTKQNKDYIEALEAVKNGASIEVINTGHTISFKYNNTEIGFLSAVITNETNTEFKRSSYRTGLNWIVKIDNEGNILSNYDELFEKLFEADDEQTLTLSKILDARHKETLIVDNDIASFVYEYFKTIKDNTILNRLYNSNNQLQDVANILDSINSVIYQKDAILKSKEEYLDSYNSWLEKVFDNYSKTFKLQQMLLESNDKFKVTLQNIGYQKPLFANKNIDISTLPFIKEENTIFGVTSEGIPMTENGNHKFNPRTIFEKGRMGFLLKNVNGNPIIAKFTESNTVNSSQELLNAVNNYLYEQLESYNNNKLSYEELAENLTNLLATNPLFYGYKILRTNKAIMITKGDVNYWKTKAKSDDKNIAAIIYRQTNKGKDIKAYTFFNDKGQAIANTDDFSNVLSFSQWNPNYIKDLVSNLTEDLYFNMSLLPLEARGKKDYQTNKYFYKENNKFIVNIGNYNKVYDDYFSFVMENNCFKTNITSDSKGNFTENISERNDLYVDIDSIIPANDTDFINGEEVKLNDGLNVLTKATKETPASVKEIFNKMGFGETLISHLLSNKHFNIPLSLIADEVYYDSDLRLSYDAKYSNGKVFITAKGVESIRRNPQNIVRLLAHENIHRHVENLDSFDKQYFEEELLDTYNQFKNAVYNRATNGDETAIRLRTWIEENNFTPDKFKTRNTGDTAIFAEEWLVESITQPDIVNFLNTIDYVESNGEVNRNKTLLTKILELFLNLFGLDIDNINKNSILARQLVITGEHITNNNISPISITENNEASIESPVEGNEQNQSEQHIEENAAIGENSIEENEEIIFTEEEIQDILDIDVDDDYSTTPIVGNSNIENNIENYYRNKAFNPNGYISTRNMSDFVRSFPKPIQPLIADNLENGTIEYLCKV